MIGRLSCSQTRKLLALLKWENRFCLIAAILFVVSYLPISVLWPSPASGGDLGSHFWPFSLLMEQGIRHGSLRSWNPGNLFGEPHFLNYFPFPYFVMAVLALIVPVGTAFNVGVLIPIVALPLSVYFFVAQARLRAPAPLFALFAALTFLFNESYSMWGGNFLSLLAGQFAHGYGLALLFLGWGFFERELRQRAFPLRSALVFSAAFVSHAYIAMGIPWCLLGSALARRGIRRSALFLAVQVGLLVLGFTAWFWFPMILNAPWTTAFSVEWRSGKLLEEFLPNVFYPLLALGVILSATLFLWGKSQGRAELCRISLLLLPTIVAYFVYYESFSQLGLVDVRALPQLQIAGLVLAAVAVAATCRRFSGPALALIMPVLLVSTLWWIDSNSRNVAHWLDWNFSGWTTKPLYGDLRGLSQDIRGDFSDPRVAYEHAVLNDRAGSVRVFEMLPYFSGRATLESVYLQSSPAASIAYLIQALVSKTPSCPFRQFDCPHFDLTTSAAKFALAGVNTLILSSDELVHQATQQSYLLPGAVYGPWHLFYLREPVSLVTVPARAPVPTNSVDWKEEFFHWFSEYSDRADFLWVTLRGQESLPVRSENTQCHPEVEVEFNAINLKTDCIGVLHVLKFSYNPAWSSESGEQLELLSPGFIGIVPQNGEVRLVFGNLWWWKASMLVSVLVLGVALFLWNKERR